MAYYDRILNEDFYPESEGIDDAIDEGIDDAVDEGIDEALFNRRRPQRTAPRFPSSIGQRANFARNVPRTPSGGGAQGNYVTKTELRSSLDSISNQVNDLKKSSLALAASIKRIDDGYEKVVKSIAKKDRAQDNVMSGSTMMSLLSVLVNKPTLNPAALKVNDDGKTIDQVAGQDAIQVDLPKTLLFTMMPMMMNGSGSGDNNNMMMMMLMMVLLVGKPASGTSGTTTSSNDNTMLLMIPMMMMMNKK